MALPEYPELKPLADEDIGIIAGHLERYGGKICELALANFIIWQDFDKTQVTLINENPCCLISPPIESPYFLEPAGRNKLPETAKTCLEHVGKISRASEDFVSQLPQAGFRVKCLRSQFDYVYSTKILAELKGRKFDGKRNHLKNFQRRHPGHEYVPLAGEHRHGCLELFEEWFALKKESRYFPKLAYTAQKAAIEKAFDHFEKLNLIGGALLIDKEVKGFILGSRLNSETACIHFQFGHPALQGTSQTLFWEAANKTFSGFNFLNLEQDLGIPGLRKAKLSYYPLRLEKKFEIEAIR